MLPSRQENSLGRLARQFEQCALLSLEKNWHFLSFLGDHAVELDLDAGMARFTGGRSCSFQVLGTESDNSLSWLWAWADEQPEMPQELTRASRTMKEWLEKEGLGEFALPSLDLDRVDGLLLSLIAVDVCGAGCSYRDSYDGGALFLLLYGTGMPAQPPFSRRELVRHLEELIDRYDFDHRNALLSYLRKSGIDTVETPDTVSATLESGEHLIAQFDGNGKLTAVNGEKRG
jgi:hypothetical protein